MRKKRGIAMIVVMMALGLLAMTLLAITFISNRSLMQTKLQGETDEAFFAAQAGLALKVAELGAGDEDPKDGLMTESDAYYDVVVYLASESVTEVPGLTVPADHYYVLSKGYDRDPSGTGPRPREVMLGALFRQSATVYNGAALAGDTLTVTGNGYTDTWDSSTGTAGNHALAHVGVYNSSGDVTIDSGSFVGYDGGGSALADVLVPTGHTGSVSGSAGSEFAAQTVSPYLSAPDPVPARTAGSTDMVISSTPATATAPTLVSGEWVLRAKDFKIENAGTVFTLDVSGVPHGETVYIDVNEFNMDQGTFQVYDDDAGSYGSGATEVDVQVYAVSKFDVVNGGQFGTINNEPKRMVAYTEGDMRLVDMATSYMVGRSRTKVEVLGSSEVYGSVLGEGEVLIQDDGVVHYDQELQNSGSGATGGGTLQFVSYQRM